MPKPLYLRCSDPYLAALREIGDRLLTEGIEVDPADPIRVIEACVIQAGERYGIAVPMRKLPTGGYRHAAPGARTGRPRKKIESTERSETENGASE